MLYVQILIECKSQQPVIFFRLKCSLLEQCSCRIRLASHSSIHRLEFPFPGSPPDSFVQETIPPLPAVMQESKEVTGRGKLSPARLSERIVNSEVGEG